MGGAELSSLVSPSEILDLIQPFILSVGWRVVCPGSGRTPSRKQFTQRCAAFRNDFVWRNNMATSAEATGSQIVVESTSRPGNRRPGTSESRFEKAQPRHGRCPVLRAQLARQDILRRQQCSSVLRLVSGGFDGRSLCSSWPDTPVHGDQGPQLISSNACLGRELQRSSLWREILCR